MRQSANSHFSWQLDSSYTVRYVVSPYGAIEGDLHDFQITSNDTVIITAYEPIPYDLTSVGGPELGWLYDGVIQEIDMETGELLFEWRSSSFYPPESSFEPLGNKGHERTLGYDYFHLNSVDKDDYGRYLISARHTHTVTCIDGITAEVLWSLGGKDNQFFDESDGIATQFSWQHDARWRGPSTITLFDNAANAGTDPSLSSHGILLELDISARKAKVLRSYDHPQELLVVSQGNMQTLDTGNVLVGWGHSAAFTEFSPEGEVVCDVHFGASAYFTFGRIVSYRSFKSDWIGMPNTLPDTAITEDSVFVSWNGATEVATWRLEAWDGSDLKNMTFYTVHDVERTGFETQIPFTSNVTSYFRVAAIDSENEVIGMTEIHQRASEPVKQGYTSSHPWRVAFMLVFILGLIPTSLYFAVTRCKRWQIFKRNRAYRLVAHKDEDDVYSRDENSHLPI